MQKRRGHNAATSTNQNGLGLPLTSADVTKNPAPRQTRRRRKGRSSRHASLLGCLVVSVTFLGVTLVGIHFLGGSSSKKDQRRVEEEEQVESPPVVLPLSQFDSLQYALENSQLVGLYFAAAWCPHSTPVSNMIDEVLGEHLLPPPSNDNPPPSTKAPMSLVYVSSDRSETAFLNYHRRNWMSVPFDSEDERTAIKRHFSVCAKPEVERLKIDRKFEIPTLVVLDGPTRGILTTNGAEDLEEFKENVLDHWLQMHDLVRAMEEKYHDGGGSIQVKDNKKKHHPVNADSFSSLFQ